MSECFNLELKNTKPYLMDSELENLKSTVAAAHKKVHEGTGAGSDFLGWIDLPVNYDKKEFEKIKKSADKIRNNSDVLIVIGIGGSYLGARAAIEMFSHSFSASVSKEKRKNPEVFSVGII